MRRAYARRSPKSWENGKAEVTAAVQETTPAADRQGQREGVAGLDLEVRHELGQLDRQVGAGQPGGDGLAVGQPALACPPRVEVMDVEFPARNSPGHLRLPEGFPPKILSSICPGANRELRKVGV